MARWSGARRDAPLDRERAARIRRAVIRAGRGALFRHGGGGTRAEGPPAGASVTALLSVTAPTESEALCAAWAARKGVAAARAARASGVAPRGGLALLLAGEVLREAEVLPERVEVVEVVRRALEEPLLQLAANQGEVPGHVVRRTRASGFELAFNGATGELEPQARLGTLDAAATLQGALRHAASIVRLVVLAGLAVVGASIQAPRGARPERFARSGA